MPLKTKKPRKMIVEGVKRKAASNSYGKASVKQKPPRKKRVL